MAPPGPNDNHRFCSFNFRKGMGKGDLTIPPLPFPWSQQACRECQAESDAEVASIASAGKLMTLCDFYFRSYGLCGYPYPYQIQILFSKVIFFFFFLLCTTAPHGAPVTLTRPRYGMACLPLIKRRLGRAMHAAARGHAPRNNGGEKQFIFWRCQLAA